MSSLPPDDRDPRPRPSDLATPTDSGGDLRPAVAATRPRNGLGWVLGGAVVLGLLTFVVLNAHRSSTAGAGLQAPGQSAAVAPAPPPPPDLVAAEAAGRSTVNPAPSLAPPALPQPPAVAIVTPATKPTATGALVDPAELGRKAPALVVDLAAPAAVAATVSSPATPGASTGAKPGGGPGGPSGLNADEQFAERVGASEPERSRATLLRNTQQTIPQGAMIPGVLETALDSDLPGYARAVVSRDVRGFDGTTVLVPRGSRVIGQYKSAVSQGQSRAFVIWTRIIRPDGASIQIGSSGTDPLGRAGLDGTVDRHFFERFGGAVLLSVVNAGVNSLARAPSNEVVIGSNTDAASLGASVLQPAAIPPTIKVPQGAPIRIFVARDLDFSPVGAAR